MKKQLFTFILLLYNYVEIITVSTNKVIKDIITREFLQMAISKIPYGGFHIFVAILLTILCIGAIPAAVIGSRFSKFRRFCNRKVNSDIGPVKMTELEKSTEEDETNCQDVEAGDV